MIQPRSVLLPLSRCALLSQLLSCFCLPVQCLIIPAVTPSEGGGTPSSRWCQAEPLHLQQSKFNARSTHGRLQAQFLHAGPSPKRAHTSFTSPVSGISEHMWLHIWWLWLRQSDWITEPWKHTNRKFSSNRGELTAPCLRAMHALVPPRHQPLL